MARYSYGVRVALGLDQLANTVLGGWPDETLSARAWRCRRMHWYWQALVAVLNTIAPGHCRRAWHSERRDTQSPPSER